MTYSDLIFAKETPGQKKNAQFSWKIMIIDDEADVHEITRTVLKDFSYEKGNLTILSAFSRAQAKLMIEEHPDTALIIGDVVMETDHAGLDLIHHIRKNLKNDLIQIAIRTGQPGQAPEADIIIQYLINSYHSKTEMTAQKLISLVTTSLRTYKLGMNLQKELAKRTQTENKLKELNLELENRVKKRTALLEESNKKIQFLADRADRANQNKSDFLANMSHEIRTPMNGIMGMARILLEEELSHDQREYARIILSSADSLLIIINDILDISKIEASELLLMKKDFSPALSLKGIKTLLKVRAEEKGLALTTELAVDVPEIIHGDEGRIRQILINLAGNGIKFTQKGSVNISGRIQTREGKRPVMIYEVADTGPGISQEFQKIMFDKFLQASSPLGRIREGTGLGLTICKKLAALMNGRIEVESQPGKGSLFRVFLEVDHSSNMKVYPDQGIPKYPLPQEPNLNQGRKSALILLAEDNPVNQKIALILFKKWGFKADVANNGIEALSMLQEKQYSLILMDINMPKLDGFETVKRIRSTKSNAWFKKDIPIIAMTAHAMKEDRHRCLDAGMDRYLSKPVEPARLLETIMDLLPA